MRISQTDFLRLLFRAISHEIATGGTMWLSELTEDTLTELTDPQLAHLKGLIKEKNDEEENSPGADGPWSRLMDTIIDEEKVRDEAAHAAED